MVKMADIFVVIASLFVAHQSFTESCDAGKFVKTDGMELPNHVVQTITRILVELCWGECLWFPWCLSINVRNVSESEFECDLNNKTGPGGLVAKTTSDYYEKTRPREVICKMNECNRTEGQESSAPQATTQAAQPPTTQATQPLTTQAVQPTSQAEDCQLDFPSQTTSTLDYVNITSLYLKEIRAFTLSFWLKVPASYNGNLQIISYKSYNPSSEMSFYIKSNKDEGTFIINGNKEGFSSNLRRDGKWQNIALTYSSEEGKYYFYHDGGRKSRKPLTNGITLAPGGSFLIGQRHVSDSTMILRGSIADLEMWGVWIKEYQLQEFYEFRCQSAKNYRPGDIISWKQIVDSIYDGQVVGTCPTTCPS